MEDLINLEDLQDLSQEEVAERIAQANEAHKKYVSDSERGVQEVIKNKKMSEAAIEAIAEINGDNDKLLEVYERDPKLGQYILDRVLWGKKIEDFKDGGKSNTKLSKDEMEEFYQQKKVDEKLDSVYSSLPEQSKEKFDEVFKDITDGKKLTPANLDKYIKMALKEVEPNYSEIELEARAMSSNGGYASKWADKSWIKADPATLELLQKYGSYTPTKK